MSFTEADLIRNRLGSRRAEVANQEGEVSVGDLGKARGGLLIGGRVHPKADCQTVMHEARIGGSGAIELRNRSQPGSRKVTQRTDRKSTRLNSSHLGISYAVFCL